MPTIRGSILVSADKLDEILERGIPVTFRYAAPQEGESERIPRFSMEAFKSKWTSREFKLFQKDIGKEDFEYLYTRCDIATNAIDIPANDVFAKWFTIKSEGEEKGEEKVSLEDKIRSVNKDVNVKGVFTEAYRYSRLYGLGIVVMGLQDSAKLREEPQNVQKIEYLAAFSSNEIKEIDFYTDPKDPKYGEIKQYKINIKTKHGARDRWVHADRVIHVMEKTLGKSPWGISVLESVYDLFTVLKNLDWSAGEAYYQQASPTFVMNYSIEPVPPSEDELDQMKEDLKEIHVLKRFIKPKEYELTTITGTGRLPNPGQFWNPIVERIAGGIKVPKQILLGTSAGALASGEVNMAQYYKDVAAIQSDFIEPLLLDFYSRLQEWGLVPEGVFDLIWNPLWEMDEKDKAQIMEIKARAAQILVGIVSKKWVFKNVLGLTGKELEDELEAIGFEELGKKVET